MLKGKKENRKKKNKGKEMLIEKFHPETYSFWAKDKITAFVFVIYHFVYKTVSV